MLRDTSLLSLVYLKTSKPDISKINSETIQNHCKATKKVVFLRLKEEVKYASKKTKENELFFSF